MLFHSNLNLVPKFWIFVLFQGMKCLDTYRCSSFSQTYEIHCQLVMLLKPSSHNCCCAMFCYWKRHPSCWSQCKTALTSSSVELLCNWFHSVQTACLMQGAHVSINARTEDDVDEKLVISKVAKASGANYGFHKEPKRPVPAAEPVVRLNLLCYSVLDSCIGTGTLCGKMVIAGGANCGNTAGDITDFRAMPWLWRLRACECNWCPDYGLCRYCIDIP